MESELQKVKADLTKNPQFAEITVNHNGQNLRHWFSLTEAERVEAVKTAREVLSSSTSDTLQGHIVVGRRVEEHPPQKEVVTRHIEKDVAGQPKPQLLSVKKRSNLLWKFISIVGWLVVLFAVFFWRPIVDGLMNKDYVLSPDLPPDIICAPQISTQVTFTGQSPKGCPTSSTWSVLNPATGEILSGNAASSNTGVVFLTQHNRTLKVDLPKIPALCGRFAVKSASVEARIVSDGEVAKSRFPIVVAAIDGINWGDSIRCPLGTDDPSVSPHVRFEVPERLLGYFTTIGLSSQLTPRSYSLDRLKTRVLFSQHDLLMWRGN